MKAFSLVSVGSRSFNPESITRLDNCANERHLHLLYIVLDGPERYNMSVFHGLHGAVARSAASRSARNYVISVGLPQNRLLYWAEAIRDLPALGRILVSLNNLFFANRSFRNLCLAQVYSNLKPRLARLGVKNQRDPRVLRASSYLLEELAFKAAAFEEGPYCAELLPVPEMPIVRDLYSSNWITLKRERLNKFEVLICDGVKAPVSQCYVGLEKSADRVHIGKEDGG